MTENDDHLAAIRERARKATPGPWGWFGNTKEKWFTLSTVRWGRLTVMQFERYGMQGSQPVFFDRPECVQPQDAAFSSSCVSASDAAVYAVCPDATDSQDRRVYRHDIVGLRNADATFIAYSRSDVDFLLAEVDRLRSELDKLKVAQR